MAEAGWTAVANGRALPVLASTLRANSSLVPAHCLVYSMHHGLYQQHSKHALGYRKQGRYVLTVRYYYTSSKLGVPQKQTILIIITAGGVRSETTDFDLLRSSFLFRSISLDFTLIRELFLYIRRYILILYNINK